MRVKEKQRRAASRKMTARHHDDTKLYHANPSASSANSRLRRYVALTPTTLRAVFEAVIAAGGRPSQAVQLVCDHCGGACDGCGLRTHRIALAGSVEAAQ